MFRDSLHTPLILTVLVLLACPATNARAAETPGLSLKIERLDEAGQVIGAADTREVRMIALAVPAGASPSSFIPAGRFRATWEGTINLRIRERYELLAEGHGAIKVHVDDKPVFEESADELGKKRSEEIRFKKGSSRITVIYDSPPAGDAIVRLLWTQKGVPPHPLPPTLFSHDPEAPATAEGRRLREGRQLLADLRCVKCHAAPEEALSLASTGNGFAELAMDAPSFQDIGARLNRDWMAAWIADPQALRFDAHMPKVFHAGNLLPGMTAETDTRAADTAAYLATLGIAMPPSPDPLPADAKEGQKLYTALACIACHIAPDADATAAAAPPRISHASIAAKFTPFGLKQYLLDPAAHYAWNPMPNFKLSESEADQIAAYLLSAGTKPVATIAMDKADALRGKALVASAGCIVCHAGTEEPATLKAPKLADLRGSDVWSRGCLAAEVSSHGSAPVFPLTETQRASIAAFAATDRAALLRDEASEFVSRQYSAMRCANCHARDGLEPALTTAFSTEFDAAYAKHLPASGKLGEADDGGVYLTPDQKQFPLLTWAGEKLRPEWTTAFITGDIAYKPRPYLRARMPAYKTRAAGLAKGLAAQHGRSATSTPEKAPDPARVADGQKLVSTIGGFSCVQCHADAGKPPLAPFEAPALDFAHIPERLQKAYYFRWMENPIALDRTTKMPRFSDDDGATPLRETLDGDAQKQFDAMWQYLQHQSGTDKPTP